MQVLCGTVALLCGTVALLSPFFDRALFPRRSPSLSIFLQTPLASLLYRLCNIFILFHSRRGWNGYLLQYREAGNCRLKSKLVLTTVLCVFLNP